MQTAVGDDDATRRNLTLIGLLLVVDVFDVVLRRCYTASRFVFKPEKNTPVLNLTVEPHAEFFFPEKQFKS